VNTRSVACFAGLFLALSGFVFSETLSFPEHNFSVELPEGWIKTDAPAPAISAAKSADGQKIFVIVAARTPDNERDTAVASISRAAKEASKAKGWKISDERQAVINGITFETYNAQLPGGAGTVASFMTSAGNEAYALQAIHKAGIANTDAELRSIVNSFRLLSPAAANMPSYDKTSFAYRLGRLMGAPCACGLLLCICIALGLGIVWFVRRKKAR
jgi:predicted Zn-dependent protease